MAGAWSAGVFGFASFFSSFTFTALLLAFYFTSSALTKVAGSIKQRLDAEFKKGGQRNWEQVFCNAAVPTCLAVTYGFLTGFIDVPFGAMYAIPLYTPKCQECAVLGQSE